jgi:death-on-curing protein
MEEFSKEIKYPSLLHIIDSNRQIINVSGGFFSPPNNLQNKNSLEYILTAIKFPIFEQILFPDINTKAAAISYEIIKSHVFYDGNKRTAIHSAWEFLQANNIYLKLDHSIEDMAEAIAKGEATREDLVRWFILHQ